MTEGHTLARGAESARVLDTIESTEMGDSQSPYGAIFLVAMAVVVKVKLSHKCGGRGCTRMTRTAVHLQ